MSKLQADFIKESRLKPADLTKPIGNPGSGIPEDPAALQKV
jgi:hypothetical protein